MVNWQQIEVFGNFEFRPKMPYPPLHTSKTKSLEVDYVQFVHSSCELSSFWLSWSFRIFSYVLQLSMENIVDVKNTYTEQNHVLSETRLAHFPRSYPSTAVLEKAKRYETRHLREQQARFASYTTSNRSAGPKRLVL